MSSKMSIEAFSLEATQQKAQFEAIKRAFESDPSLTKMTRLDAEQPYSYLWYQNLETGSKTVIRLANKNVQGHVLGAGAYGRAKYGVDQHGKIFAVKIQHTIRTIHHKVNQSLRPMDEADIAYDVKLAHGKQSKKFTHAFFVTRAQDVSPDTEPDHHTLYVYEDGGYIAYGLKNEADEEILRKTNIPFPLDRNISPWISQIKRYARLQHDIPEKTPSSQTRSSSYKSYQVLQLGESTLFNALIKQPHIPIQEKISIARRLSWECSKLHTGQLSRTHQGYIHCDLKPENIILNSKKKSVLLIDYGLSVSANTTGVLYGTPWYSPVITITHPNDGKLCLSDPINHHDVTFDKTYADRVRGMGTGFDVFAVKRVIYMPDHDDRNPGRCIFTKHEFGRLPPAFTQTMVIHNDPTSTLRAVKQINKQHETAKDLTLQLIALESVNFSLHIVEQAKNYQTNLSLLSTCHDAQQTLLCECAELMDLILVHDPAQTAYTRQDLIDAVSSSALLILKNQLLMNASMLLLNIPYDATISSALDQWLESPQAMHTKLDALFFKIKSSDDPTQQEVLKTSCNKLYQELRPLDFYISDTDDDDDDDDDDESDHDMHGVSAPG